jgi:predicted acylesterase/phospholipase RssA
MTYPQRLAPQAAPAEATRTHPALVLLQAEDGLPVPLGTAAVLLAQALAAGHGDAVLVLRLGEPIAADWAPSSVAGPPSLSPSTSIAGGQSLPPRYWTDEEGADRIEVPVPADPRDAAEALQDRLKPLFARYAYVFLDASARGPAFARGLAEELGKVDLGAAVRRLVLLHHGDGAHVQPPAPPGWSVLATRVLDPPGEDEAPPASMRPPGLRGQIHAGRRLATRLRERLGGEAIEPQGEPYPPARAVPEQCRVRLDLGALAVIRAPLLRRLPAEARASFARWGRAITWRRVGVALGGSGAWGYAHVALMQQLEARGIPIDIVGGSSSGSLMGAYYAVLGRDGLDLAIARGKAFGRLVWLSTLTSTVIDLTVDADLGGTLLEDLEVMLLPVATNLSRSRAEVITRSTVASAVRASASAPGFFAATITRSGLYVDGAITDNVPVLLVERMGADLLVACNPLPPPPKVEVRASKSALGDFLAELNPLRRLLDLKVSFELMLHDFGDCEAADNRIVYDPPPDAGTLFRTFAFGRAHELVAAVEREERFQETIRRCAEAWEKLSAPRGI